MGFELSFATLFEVKILHRYWLDRGATFHEALNVREQQRIHSQYNISDFLDIVPDSRTQSKFKGWKLLFKKTASGFRVLVRVDPENPAEPFQSLETPGKFIFKLYVRDSRFFNYTALPFPEDSDTLFYFSNRTENPLPALTRGTPEADPQNEYRPGDRVTDNQAPPTHYFAKKAVTGGPPSPDEWQADVPGEPYDSGEEYEQGDVIRKNNALYEALVSEPDEEPGTGSQWQKTLELPVHYANQTDRVTRAPKTIRVIHPLEFDAPAKFTLLNEDDEEVLTKTLHPDSDDPRFLLHTGDLPAGMYTLKRERTDTGQDIHPPQSLYFIEHPAERYLSGVIEIFSRRGPGDYDLFTPSGAMQSPVFELRFRNRYTFWKYLDGRTDDLLLDAGHQPLTRSGIIHVTLDDRALPNPGADMIKPGSGQYDSEVFLNEPQKMNAL